MYNTIEMATIVKNCKTTKELTQAANCFGYYIKRKMITGLLEKKLKLFISLRQQTLQY